MLVGAPLPAGPSSFLDCISVILFAHGSGSSRHSPRNRKVARALRASGLATLLIGRRVWSAKLPFGTYLAFGGLLWLFFGRLLLSW